MADHCVYWDWSWTGAWIMVIVVATILVEFFFEFMEERIEETHNKLLELLWGKILRELALLGIVSFIAVVMQNIG